MTIFTRQHRSFIALLIGALLAILVTTVAYRHHRIEVSSIPALATRKAASNLPEIMPWRYGQEEALFTLILYADLECPYCKAYYPALKGWVDRHPEANLQWHHLPLPMHEPAATREAQFAECMGQVNGRSAFWEAIDWIYQHTRGDGLGIPDSTPYPDLSPSIQTCLDNDRSNTVIQTQAREGSQAGISATPTLMIRENQNGRELILPGPVEGDALLSALDLLTAQNANESDAETEMPNEVVGEMPR